MEELERRRSWLWPIVVLLVSVNLVAALLLLPVLVGAPDGERMPDLVRFLGRFHPTVLHLPIGILVLAGLVELGRMVGIGRRGGSTTFAVFAGAASAVLAALCGFLLYHGGGWEESELAERHLWGGLFVAVGACVTFAVKVWADALEEGGALRWLAMATFRLLLFGTCGVMAVAGHDGASLVHGENYLTQYMPDRLRELLRLPPAGPAAPADKPVEQRVVFAELVAPVLERRCVQCHNADKQKGKLRMDSHALLLAGGKEGPAIEPGNAAKSNIIVRIELPADDDEHMPPEGKPDIEEHELAVLKWWLDGGAPETATVAEMKPTEPVLAAIAKLAPPAPKEDKAGGAPAPETADGPAPATGSARDAVAARMAPLQQEFPGALNFEAQDSDALVFTAVSMRQSFDDAALAKLKPVLGDLVALDLSATKVSDAGVAALADAGRLRMLRLSETAVSDAALAALGKLPELESLNLFGTQVTDAGLPQLAGAPKLRKLYLWQSKATPAGVEALKKQLPDCQVELGTGG